MNVFGFFIIFVSAITKKTIIIMKNKIENLIKEIGVNEVEAILNQIKLKVNVKEQLKQDFVKLLTGCIISFDSVVINYKKDGECFFYYNKTSNTFYFRYNFWLDFENKYTLNYQELKELLVGILGDVLNYKEVTPTSSFPFRL